MPTANEIQMLSAARAAGITSREEMANFMAQMGHESGGFNRLEEGFRYTRGVQQIPVDSAMREGAPALETARLEALGGRPQELARLMYGGRMGNDDAGDGYLYRGRGYTQLTGEENYRNAGNGLNLDLVGQPDLAANRENAQQIALWYWDNRVPEADRDDVTRATRGINGGTNGLEDRLNRYDAWNAVLTPEFVSELDAGRVVPGAAVAPAVGRPAMEDGALRRLETGEDVRQLNQNLRDLGIRLDGGREVPAGQSFTSHTEEGVRRFQAQYQLPVTGRADAATLQGIDRAVELQRQQAPSQPDGAQPAPNPGRRADATMDVPNQAHLQGGQVASVLTVGSRQLLDDSRSHVQRLAQANGLGWDQGMENTVYAVAQKAGETGMGRITHLKVDAGGIRMAEHDGFTLKEGRLDAMQAANTPVNESVQKLAETQQSARVLHAESREAPALSRSVA
jgi:putative chitinase